MIERKTPNIILEKISLERLKDAHEMIVESGKEWFTNGMLPKPEFSVDELEQAKKGLIEEWENGTYYMFFILDASNNQVV